MAKKAEKQERSSPLNFFKKEVQAAKKQEKSTAEGLVSSLRSDMLLTSSVSPARKNIFQRLNLKLIVGIMLGIVVIAMIWVSIAGPARPILEKNLALLVGGNASHTPTIVPLTETATVTPPQPSKTPTSTPTVRKTDTPTVTSSARPTRTSILPTSTAALTCRSVLTITLADVGQTLCVQGTVVELVDDPNGVMVIFSFEREKFYWVVYNQAWVDAKVNTCYQITGKIRQIGNSPVLAIDYRNIPEVCP